MARRLVVEIVGNSASLERSMGRATASTNALGGTFSKIGKLAAVAGLAIAGGVAYGLDKSVKAAMDAQQSQARLGAAFTASGLNADKYKGQLDAAETASRNLGFAGNEVRTALGSLVVATGNVGKSVKDLAIAEDLARFKGMGLEAATKMITSASAGNARAIKQLGIMLIPTTAAVDALKNANVKATTEAGRLEYAHAKLTDKMNTAAHAVDLVREKVKGQGEAFASTAAGSMQVFHEKLQFLEVTLGDVLLPAITRVVSVLGDLVTWLQNSGSAQHVLTTALADAKTAFDGLLAVGKTLLPFYEQHKTLVLAVGAAVGSAAGAIWILVTATKAWVAIQKILDAELLANPIGITIVALVALGTALVVAYERSQRFRDIVNGAFTAIKTVVSAVLPVIKQIITSTVATVEALWHRFGGTITSVASTAFGAVKGYVTNMYAAITGVFTLVGDLIHGRWAKIWGDLKDIVSHAFEAVWSLLKGYVKIMFTAASAIGAALVHGVISGLEGIATSAEHAVTGFFSGLIRHAKAAVGVKSPSTVFHGIGVDIMQGLQNGMESRYGQVHKSLQNFTMGLVSDAHRNATEIITTLEGPAITSITRSANAVTAPMAPTQFQTTGGAPLSDWWVQSQIQNSLAANPLASTGGYQGPAFNLPTYASGGVVPGIGPRLAVVHGGEQVIPVGGARGSGGVTITVTAGTVVGAGGMQQLAETIRTEFIKMHRRGSNLGFA